MWSDVQESGPSASWLDLPENGWGALIGWAAGLDNLRRRPSSGAGGTITGYTERGGKQQPFEEPFSSFVAVGPGREADRPGTSAIFSNCGYSARKLRVFVPLVQVKVSCVWVIAMERFRNS